MDAQAVYGLQVPPQHAALVKRVMTLALIAALLQVARGIYSVAEGQPIYMSLFAVALGLLVPACGYCGAKKNDSKLMCLFCGCNGFAASQALMGLLLMVFAYTALKGLDASVGDIQECGRDMDPQACTSLAQSGRCTAQATASGPDCCQCVKDVLAGYPGMIGLEVAFAIPSFFLSACAFWFGKKLHSELKAGVVVVAVPNMVATQAVMLQPPA